MHEILTPIAFFAACVAIVYFSIQAKLKRRELEHQERMLAIEKGAQIPITPDHRRHHNPYFWPLLFIAVGLGLFMANILDGDDDWVWSVIPLFIGISMLYAHQRLVSDEKKVKHAAEIPPAAQTTIKEEGNA